MRALSQKETKETLVNILTYFDKLCEENGLYYTLCGGTLLGAIRHKGFIPWDDDIDVLMPRADYDRLLNDIDIDKSCLPDYIRVVSWKRDEMNYPFMKMVDERTEVENKYIIEKKDASKVWIDIFAIDGNPTDDKKLADLFRKSLFYRRILCLKTAKLGEGKTISHKLFKPFLKAFTVFFKQKKLCKKIDDIAKTYPYYDTEYIGGVLWGYGVRERIHRKPYMEPVKVEFEGHMFNAPSNYDEYLKGLYGDYMTLPPEKDRISHEIKAFVREG